MKPHFTNSLQPMIEYLASQKDISSIPNDAENLKGNMSFLQQTSDSNFCNYESNLKHGTTIRLTPDKIERMKKFYSGNSIDQPKNDKLKLKNINLDYYGIKARSSSRQQKHTKHLDFPKKKSKREHILIDNSISNMIFDSIIINEKGANNNKASSFNNHFMDTSQRQFKTIFQNDKENVDDKLKSLCENYNSKRVKNKPYSFAKKNNTQMKLK